MKNRRHSIKKINWIIPAVCGLVLLIATNRILVAWCIKLSAKADGWFL
jgi:hypothetical protein